MATSESFALDVTGCTPFPSPPLPSAIPRVKHPSSVLELIHRADPSRSQPRAPGDRHSSRPALGSLLLRGGRMAPDPIGRSRRPIARQLCYKIQFPKPIPPSERSDAPPSTFGGASLLLWARRFRLGADAVLHLRKGPLPPAAWCSGRHHAVVQVKGDSVLAQRVRTACDELTYSAPRPPASPQNEGKTTTG